MSEIDGDRLLTDLATLRSFGARGTGVHRPAFSEVDTEARHWLAGRMMDAGLAVHIDGIGNIHGRSATSRAILSGSHIDTVPEGGWLDGAYGTIVALEAARVLNGAAGADGVGVDVICFADEEGRFRGTMGSRALCGDLSEAEIAATADASGVRLLDALADAGWANQPIDRLDPQRHIAFLEAHIEQGPVLEHSGENVGVVTGIVGIRRIEVAFHGRSDHAGTTPMVMRKDAGAAAVAFAHAFAELMAEHAAQHTVWNIGAVDLRPGFGNVVPNTGTVTIEYRDMSNDLLVGVDAAVAELAGRVAERHAVPHAMTQVASDPAIETDPRLQNAFAAAAESLGATCRRMPSGAGHDAMILARHLPTAMLFSPSVGGRSHCDAEDTRPDDLVRTARVFTTAIGALQTA